MGNLAAVPPDLMKQIPAGANPVDAIPAPGAPGGWLVLGKDGGVFALGGAGFLGSYPGLPSDQRTISGSFQSIEPTADGGYRIVSSSGEGRVFSAPKPPPPSIPDTPIAAPPPPSTTAVTTTSAKGLIDSILGPLGLSGVGDKALSWAIDSGNDPNYIFLKLRDSDEYKAAFPEMSARQKAGLPPITEADILNYRNTAKQLFKQAGIPTDAVTDKEISDFIAGDVSPVEIQDRIQKGLVAAMQAPPELRAALAEQGVDLGQLTHFFLDPTKATDTIMKRAAIGAAAAEQGYGTLTAAEMAKLQGAGVSEAQAQRGFGELYQQRELLGQLPGEGGQGISRDTQLGYVQGQAPAAEQIQKEAERRVAAFKGSSAFGAAKTGVAGLGVTE